MKIVLRPLMIAATLAVSCTGLARDENFHIFLCFGQSNMEGFPGIPESEKQGVDPRFQVLAAVNFPELQREKGKWYTAVPPLSRPRAGLSPADYFGRALVARLPAGSKVGVVNVAVGGCKIELFDKDGVKAYVASAPGWMKNALNAYDNDPYARLIELGRLAQQSGVIRGILLHQGESNVNDTQWPAKVKAIYENLLRDLELRAEDVPLLAGEVVGAGQKGKAAGMNRIIARLPDIIPTAHVVPSIGCEGLPDGLHFSPAGYQELGRPYADTMLPLLKTNAP